MFLDALDAILDAMLTQTHMHDLRGALPASLFPAENGVQILDRRGNVQPIGAWGTLYENGVNSGRTARILPDGTVDNLEDSGRCVMVENMTGRNFPDLQRIETVLRDYPGVDSAEAFSCYWQDNNIALCADIISGEAIDRDALNAYLEKNLKKSDMPQYLFKNGTLWK
jgi:hypothetical protein